MLAKVRESGRYDITKRQCNVNGSETYNQHWPELNHSESFYGVCCTSCMLLGAGLQVAGCKVALCMLRCKLNKCPKQRWNGISFHSEMAYMFFRRRCLDTSGSLTPDWSPETGLAPLTAPSICTAICTYEQAENLEATCFGKHTWAEIKAPPQNGRIEPNENIHRHDSHSVCGGRS